MDEFTTTISATRRGNDITWTVTTNTHTSNSFVTGELDGDYESLLGLLTSLLAVRQAQVVA